MPDLRTVLTTLRFGDAQHHRSMAMFPLIHPDPQPAFYLTLDDALARRLVRITETSPGGSVPELRVVNTADRPVLLLDGEELVGTKQNRTLNLTILVPPKSELVVPVTCVERGRWRHSAAEVSSPSLHYAEARARKMAAVSASLRSHQTPVADQGEVWRGIDAKMARMGSSSPTAAMEDIYRQHARDLEGYLASFAACPGQCGAVFALGGVVRGAEVFDSPETLRKIG